VNRLLRDREGFVPVRPGIQLYYRELGDGPDAVVVPNASWLAPVLQPLAQEAGRRLILYDPRSRGRSSAVTDRRQLGIGHDVEDLERIRQFFGLDRMALLGTSFHAAITTLYALDSPERTGRLLLVCPITARRPLEWVQETPRPQDLILPPGVPRLAEMRRDGLDESDPVAYCRAWFNYYLLPAQMSELAAASRFPLDDVCSFPNEWPQHTMALYFDQILPGMGDWDFRPRLAETAFPFLVIQGTDDLVPVDASREWVSGRENARFLRIEGAGHHPYLERPREFFAAATAFLDGEWPRESERVAAS
jgi:proline iminopeptidase